MIYTKKITLSLDEDILEEASKLADQNRVSLGSIVSDLARRGLATFTPGAPLPGFTPPPAPQSARHAGTRPSHAGVHRLSHSRMTIFTKDSNSSRDSLWLGQKFKVLRGGSCDPSYDTEDFELSFRKTLPHSIHDFDNGFRVVLVRQP